MTVNKSLLAATIAAAFAQQSTSSCNMFRRAFTAATKGNTSNSKLPHQGEKECARRREQLAKGIIKQ